LTSFIPRDSAPSAVFTLTERDFRFNLIETAKFFGNRIDAPTVERIDRLTHGWPLALEVIRRGFRRGLLDRLLDDVHDVEYQSLDPYIETEVLAGLSDAEVDGLCTLSILGETTPADLRDCLPLWLSGDIVRTLPFVRFERDRVSETPILSAFLERACHDRRLRVARGIAEALVQRHDDWIRATSIALDVGDTAYAAELAQNVRISIAGSPADVAAIVARFDRTTLVRHPALWVKTAVYRLGEISLEEFLSEGATVWAERDSETPPATLAGVAGLIMALHVQRGDWDAVATFRRTIETKFAHADERTRRLIAQVDAVVETGILAARMQRVDLTAFMAEIAPLLAADHSYALVLTEIIARVHIARGDREAQRQALDEAALRARLGGIHPVLAMCLQEAATMAWIAGEDLLFDLYTEELEQLVSASPALKRGAAHFLHCARGRGISARTGTEKPSARALSWLIAAGMTSAPGERRTLLDRALRAADASRSPHPMILARLAMAAALPGAAQRWTEAEEIAANANPAFWQSLLAPHAEGDRSRSFVSRFGVDVPRENNVHVLVLEGAVEFDGKKVHISPKEFQLFALLAMSDAALDTEALCDALWPGATLDRGAAALRVYVSRARRRIGDRACIEIEHGRYRAASFVHTDLEQIETALRRVPARPSHSEISRALRWWFALIAGPPAFLIDLPAFSSLNARVNDLIDRMEAWLVSVRERAHESDRQRITMALEADTVS
jgi:hypothetical protein